MILIFCKCDNIDFYTLNFRKCRDYGIERSIKDEKNNHITKNESIKTENFKNNDSDWMTAIKAEAKLGRQLILQNLIEHPYIEKTLISNQVVSFL